MIYLALAVLMTLTVLVTLLIFAWQILAVIFGSVLILALGLAVIVVFEEASNYIKKGSLKSDIRRIKDKFKKKV